jgi:hypothetical protein
MGGGCVESPPLEVEKLSSFVVHCPGAAIWWLA